MINKVILMGRLTRDPEFRQTTSGIPCCRFTVAIDRAMSKEKQADFINVVAWRQSAEFVSRYFSKGKMIIVEGSLQNDNYTDNNGVKHYGMNVIADRVSFGESKGASQGGDGEYASRQQQFADNGGYGQPAPQQSYAPQAAPKQQESLSIGELGEFEEILSDGEVPF